MKRTTVMWLLVLVLVICSCVSTHRVEMPPIPELDPVKRAVVVSPRGAETFSKFAAAPAPVKTLTNTLPFEWKSPNAPGLVGYSLCYGTNTGKYISRIAVGNVTNFTLTSVSQIISTNPWVRVKTFPDGRSYTNVSTFYYAVTALYDPRVQTAAPTNANGYAESAPSNEILWPPAPAPPWSAVLLSWGTTVRNVTVVGTTNLKVPVKNWPAVTNITGTNVLLSLQPNGLFFKAFTTNNPPVTLQIRGAYINGTN